MSTYHLRVENSLSRAEELIAVGQVNTALQLLHDAIMSKGFHHNLANLDAMMSKYVELCVQLRRGRMAKDGLLQYRNVCQNVNVQGVESIFRKFLECSERKVVEAHSVAEQKALEQLKDLELEETPESMLLSSVAISVDDSKERTDREIVTPWLRFMWEAYRLIIDILRHNGRLESFYQVVVFQALRFCEKYQRKAEFRRLHEILRHHLNIIIKYPNQQYGVVLTNPESHQLQLDIRFAQLNIAINLELWQEAFRSIEDIQGLFIIAPNSAKPVMIAHYYEKLIRIFHMSENYLFLAAAWNKMFALALGHNRPEEDLRRMADAVLISALSIPLIVETSMSAEDVNVKNSRLAYFLSMTRPPTRASLVREAIGELVVSHVSEEWRPLIELVEKDFEPQSWASKLDPIFASLGADKELAKFVKPLQTNFMTRLVSRLAESELPISMEEIARITTLKSCQAQDPFFLERFLLDSSKAGLIKIQINHADNSVRFGGSTRHLLNITGEKLHVGGCIEDEGWKKMTAQLQPFMKKAEPAKSSVAASYLALLETEHRANLGRKAVIEKKKEQMEALLLQKERDEQREKMQRMQLEQELERRRIAEENVRREQERLARERENVRKEEARKREEDVRKLKAEKELRVDQERLDAIAKKIDHLERAFRKEEIPLLHEDYEQQKTVDRQIYNAKIAEVMQKAKAKHEADLEIKAKLAAMAVDYEKYSEMIRARRIGVFEAAHARNAKLLAEEKARRRENLYQEWEARKAAELLVEQQKRELAEAEAKQQAEQERLASERAEKLAKIQAEREEQLKAEKALIEKRRKLEEEAETQRLAKIRGQAPQPVGASTLSSTRAMTAATPAVSSSKAQAGPEVWRKSGSPSSTEAAESTSEGPSLPKPAPGAYVPPRRSTPTAAPTKSSQRW